MSAQAIELLERASRLEKWPLARLLSLFETQTDAARSARHQVMRHIQSHPEQFTKQGLILGITGTPGAGKSSLIGALCLQLLERNPDASIAVLAVDPSSQTSGGALLGDRTRTQFPPDEKRLFFRSQASDLDLGGVGKKSFQVTRVLRQLFDFVIIETVGIGQSEVEIEQLSDYSCLVLQPFAGDQVQFMKAGIMEIPDAFIINKCDEDSLAKKSYHLLKSSLKLMHLCLNDRAIDDQASETRRVFMTSATKLKGIGELADFFLGLASHTALRKCHRQREDFYLKKQLRNEFGEFGCQAMMALLDSANPILTNPDSSYEEKEDELLSRMKQLIPSLG